MESEQKSKQFCSVCKEWLDMEVVPTGDGDDDGVIWYRCPQCQGFLPKLSASAGDDAPVDEAADEPGSDEPVPAADSASASASGSGSASGPADDSSVEIDDLSFDSPAEMMAAEKAAREARRAAAGDEAATVDDATPSLDDLEADDSAPAADEESGADAEKPEEEAEPAEPIAEYAARLEAALSELPPDEAGGKPYRPWETYEMDQCIQHLAWDDCGIVVGKESLPGGRKVVKVFFQEAGVVRLIEQAPK